jgi:hypothetical protein
VAATVEPRLMLDPSVFLAEETLAFVRDELERSSEVASSRRIHSAWRGSRSSLQRTEAGPWRKSWRRRRFCGSTHNRFASAETEKRLS